MTLGCDDNFYGYRTIGSGPLLEIPESVMQVFDGDCERFFPAQDVLLPLLTFANSLFEFTDKRGTPRSFSDVILRLYGINEANLDMYSVRLLVGGDINTFGFAVKAKTNEERYSSTFRLSTYPFMKVISAVYSREDNPYSAFTKLNIKFTNVDSGQSPIPGQNVEITYDNYYTTLGYRDPLPLKISPEKINCVSGLEAISVPKFVRYIGPPISTRE